MLEVVLYKTNQELVEKIQSEPLSQIVCPSPIIADNLRALLPGADILTISKWTTDLLKIAGLCRAKKSDLLLKLSAVWRHYFPNGKKHQFTEAFELFTELRSFTLNLEVLSEFFKELHEDLVKSILIFWAYVEQEKIIDEHLGYLHVADSEINRTVIFIGFKHMGGVQIDMLKKLGDQGNVNVFFPFHVFSEVLPNDWIKWLCSDDLPTRPSMDMRPLKALILSKGKVNKGLKDFLNKHSHDIVMATSNVELRNAQEVHIEGYFFKSVDDLFASKVEEIKLRLKDLIKSNNGLSCGDVLNFLKDLSSESLLKQDYRRYKMIELTMSALDIYKELHEKFDIFALDIVAEVLVLNAPRSSLISIEKKATNYITDINGLSFRPMDRAVAVMATSGMGSFRSNEKILSEAMTKALRTIGPIKRAGLDFLFNKHEVTQVLKHEGNILFIEEEMLESDISWRDILKNFTLIIENDLAEIKDKDVVDYLLLKQNHGAFKRDYHSASSLQTYIDCPRKYYFSYISKIDSTPAIKSTLAPEELGKLEHKIIAEYFSRSRLEAEIDLQKHQMICEEIFRELISAGQYVLSRTDYARNLNEVLHYTLNGIILLKEFCKTHNAINVKFEVPLKSNVWRLKGSIDCIVELADSQLAVFDFKRSSAAVGSKYETLEFKKIQMWVYLLALHFEKKTIASFGYVNLSEIDDDKLIFLPEEAQKILSVSLKPAQEWIESVIQNVQHDECFLPNPRDMKVCQYCQVRLFCHKRSLV